MNPVIRCVTCGGEAEYILYGNSFCHEHYLQKREAVEKKEAAVKSGV